MDSLYPEELIEKVEEVKDKVIDEYFGSFKEDLLNSKVGDMKVSDV